MQQIRPGDLLDDYRVDALHATSAMASVYRATDLRTGNPVALKTPCTGGGAALLARLRREAKVGREIDHPGVVSFLAERRSDPEYVAMEWVEGESIREVLLREGSLPVRRAIGIAVLICDALYCIHSLGQHRDLKPENIILGPRDSVKIVDFGVAGRDGEGSIAFTRVQPGAAGTPDYMNARLVADPTPLTELGCEVSPQIEAIVERALRRDPNRRYPSAAEFSFDLERPDSVRIDQRECFSLKKRIMAFSTLAVIPVILLGLLIYAASRQ